MRITLWPCLGMACGQQEPIDCVVEDNMVCDLHTGESYGPLTSTIVVNKVTYCILY